MKSVLITFLIYCVLFHSHLVHAQGSFEESFNFGVQSYNEKKYQEAADSFTKALEFDDSNPSALTNLALTQFQLGQKPIAIALLRKALNQEPDFVTALSALDYIKTQYEIKEIPHKIEFWEDFRLKFLSPFSLSSFLTLSALFLFVSGWFILTYVGQRRISVEKNNPFPSFPILGFILSVLFFISVLLSTLKYFDTTVPRGTVIEEKALVLAAPDEKSVNLFEVYGGSEVIIEQFKDDWVQITYPGGMTGWIKGQALLTTTGNKK